MTEEGSVAALCTVAGWTEEAKEEWEHCCFDFVKEEVSK